MNVIMQSTSLQVINHQKSPSKESHVKVIVQEMNPLLNDRIRMFASSETLGSERSRLVTRSPCDPYDDIISDIYNGETAVFMRRVYISVVFLKIGEIDTLKEQYEADVLLKCRWREPSLDKDSQGSRTDVDWESVWNPKLFIENTIGDPKETSFQMLTYSTSGEAYVMEKRRIKGTFLENLELMDFPFDVQDLTVTVMSERPALEVEIVDDPDDLHRVNKQSFIDEQEWQLYKYIETEVKEISYEYSDPSIKRSAFSARCQAARRPAYFFYNIFLVTFLICSLAFATFSVERTLPQNRLQLSFTLVLTSVAFKFVVNQSLPKISYLTYLDKYVLASMIMLTLVCTWHALTTVTGGKSDVISRNVDVVMLGVLSGGYVLFNVIFCIRIYLGPGRQRRMLQKKEKEYAQKVKDRLMQAREVSQKYQLAGSPFHVTNI